jgi:hypothetical protein
MFFWLHEQFDSRLSLLGLKPTDWIWPRQSQLLRGLHMSWMTELEWQWSVTACCVSENGATLMRGVLGYQEIINTIHEIPVFRWWSPFVSFALRRDSGRWSGQPWDPTRIDDEGTIDIHELPIVIKAKGFLSNEQQQRHSILNPGPWIPVKSVNFPLIFPGSLHRIPWVRPLRNSAGWHQGHSFIWSAARQLRASRPSVDVSFLLLTGCSEYVPSQSHLGALGGIFVNIFTSVLL